MSRSGALACVVALFAGLFTAGAASGSQGRLLGGIVSTVTTTVTNVVTNPLGVVETTTGTVTNVVTNPAPVVSTATDAVTNIVTTGTNVVTTVTNVVNTTTTVLTNATNSLPLPTTTTAPTVPATGDVGGTVTGAVQGVTDALAAVTGDTTGGRVSPAALGTLLTSVFGAASGNSADKTAPQVGLKVLTRLAMAARTGKLKIRVTTNEPAVVALSSALRAGKARRIHGKALKVSHALVKTRATVLAFRTGGPVTATITLPRNARQSLANARSARIALQAWASDVSRNQTSSSVKRTVRR